MEILTKDQIWDKREDKTNNLNCIEVRHFYYYALVFGKISRLTLKITNQNGILKSCRQVYATKNCEVTLKKSSPWKSPRIIY